MARELTRTSPVPRTSRSAAGDGEGREASGAAEAERVTRARAGDRAAFADLIRIHRPRVQRVALRLLGSPEDAEDVAQETFVRAWRGLDRPASAGSFGSWLLGITVHLCRDHQRAHGRLAEHAAAELLAADARGHLVSREPEPDARSSEAELRARVDLAIAALPHNLRVPFVLRALEGEDYAEIARITGVRAATVRTQMVQARRALRRALGPLLDGANDEAS